MQVYAKALAGLVMAAVAPLGIDAFTSFEEGVSIIIAAVLTGLAVYIVPNKE